jgi:hypothetical protein
MQEYNLQKNPLKETKILQDIIYFYKEMGVHVLDAVIRVSRSQVPRRPTWGSKYAAMRKELEHDPDFQH